MPSGVYERTEHHKKMLKKWSVFKKGHKIGIGNKNHLGKKHSEEVKKKMSKIQKMQYAQGKKV